MSVITCIAGLAHVLTSFVLLCMIVIRDSESKSALSRTVSLRFAVVNHLHIIKYRVFNLFREAKMWAHFVIYTSPL